MKLHRNIKHFLLILAVGLATALTGLFMHSTTVDAAAVILKGGPFVWKNADGKAQLPASFANTTLTVTYVGTTAAPDPNNPRFSSNQTTTVTAIPPGVAAFDPKGVLTVTGLTSDHSPYTVTLKYKGAGADKITDATVITQTYNNVPATKTGVNYIVGTEATTVKPIGKDIGAAVQAAGADPCEGATGLIGRWILCPIAQNMLGSIQLFYSLIQPLLQINPLTATQGTGDPQPGSSTPIFAVWDAIKNIANIALVFIFFVIIFSQATSLGVGSYGIKKILPKLVIGAIAINISFYVCSFMVDAFNVTGAGITGIVTSALNGAGVKLGGIYSTDSVIDNINGVGAIVAILIFAIPLLLVVLLFFIIGVVILLVRQVLIVLLVVLAPLAFAAWLLPNTEKYFSKWWSTFFRLLVIYPAIALLFASVQIIQTLLDGVSRGADPSVKPILLIFSLIIIGLPLMLIPMIFKSTGGAMGGIYNWVDAKRKSAQRAGTSALKNSDLNKYRKQRSQLLKGQELTGTYAGNNPLRKARSKTLRGLYDRPGFNQATGGFGGYKLDNALQARAEAGKRVSQFASTNPVAARSLLAYAQSGDMSAFDGLDESSKRAMREQARQGIIGGGVNGAATAEIALGALAKSGKLTNNDVRIGETIANTNLSGDQRLEALSSMANSIVGNASERGAMQHVNWGVKNDQLDQAALEPQLDVTSAIQKEIKKKSFPDLHYSTFNPGTGGREAFDDLIKRDAAYRNSALSALKDNRVSANIKEDIRASLAFNGFSEDGKVSLTRMQQVRTSPTKIDPGTGSPVLGPSGQAIPNNMRY